MNYYCLITFQRNESVHRDITTVPIKVWSNENYKWVICQCCCWWWWWCWWWCFDCILLVDDNGRVISENAHDQTETDIKPEQMVDGKPCDVDSGKRFTCNDCDFATDHGGHYKRHMTSRHNRQSKKASFACERCNKQFVSASDLNRHVKKTHGVSVTDPVPCPCCDEKFDSASDLESHLCDAHDVKENVLSCHSCSFRFVHAKHLNCTANFNLIST